MVLIFIGLSIGAVHSWVRPVALRLKPQAVVEATGEKPAEDGAAPIEDPPVDDPAAGEDPLAGYAITIDQARAIYDEGLAVWVDAREPEEFAVERIPGAFNIAPSNVNAVVSEFMTSFQDTGALVVIYCGGGDCHASEQIASILGQAGYTAIKIMKDGFPAWKTAGLDVEQGP